MIFSPRRAVGATALVATALVLAGCGSAPTPPPRTVTVTRAAVETGVSAMGSVAATSSNNIGFPKGGQLTEVTIDVGDRVRAGQVLAKIDDFGARQALEQAQAGLAGQQASDNMARDNTAVDGAGNSVAQARRILKATQGQVDATLATDDQAIHQAESAAAEARAGAQTAQAQYAQTQAACSSGGGAAAYSNPSLIPPVAPPTAQQSNTSCILLPGAQSQAAMAQQGVAQADSQLAQARSKKQIDEASGRVQVEQARNGLVMTQNQLDASSADRPNQLDAAQAAVDNARVGVQNAERDLANTVLRAPIDGQITAVNGAVGEFLQPSSGTTPLAPGGQAAIPGAASAGAGAAAASAGGAAGGASPSRPGGSEFVVMQNTSGFSVVAPFQEIDAASLVPGQQAHVTLDAFAGRRAAGHRPGGVARVDRHRERDQLLRHRRHGPAGPPAQGRPDGPRRGDHRRRAERGERPELGGDHAGGQDLRRHRCAGRPSGADGVRARTRRRRPHRGAQRPDGGSAGPADGPPMSTGPDEPETATTGPVATEDPPAEEAGESGRRPMKRSTRIGLAVILVLALLAAVAFTASYILDTRNYVTTDNAQIDGTRSGRTRRPAAPRSTGAARRAPSCARTRRSGASRCRAASCSRRW